jgi:hypothetical protein
MISVINAAVAFKCESATSGKTYLEDNRMIAVIWYVVQFVKMGS